jgi:uncharacterized membrane protein
VLWIEGVGFVDFAAGICCTMGVITGLAFLLESRVFCALHTIEHLLFVLAIGMMLYHDAFSDYIGMALLIAAIASNYVRSRKLPAT